MRLCPRNLAGPGSRCLLGLGCLGRCFFWGFGIWGGTASASEGLAYEFVDFFLAFLFLAWIFFFRKDRVSFFIDLEYFGGGLGLGFCGSGWEFS